MHSSNETQGIDGARLREVARACACANLRKAARIVTQIYDAALMPSGLRCTQFTLLATVRLTGEESINGLAEKMVMDRTTLSRNLKPLVRDDLLEILPGKDSRTRLIRISAKGEHALAEAYPLWKEAQEAMVNALGRKRLEALLGDVGLTISLASRRAQAAPS